MFLLMDGRAKGGDVENASVLDTAETEEAVRRTVRRIMEGRR